MTADQRIMLRQAVDAAKREALAEAHGRLPATGWCRRCGIDRNKATPGCKACATRRNARRARATT